MSAKFWVPTSTSPSTLTTKPIGASSRLASSANCSSGADARSSASSACSRTSFPRAFDIARQFRAEGVQVCIGGFHVSGCIAMLPDMPAELREAQALGISLFAGEAEEHRLDEVLLDAWRAR